VVENWAGKPYRSDDSRPANIAAGMELPLPVKKISFCGTQDQNSVFHG
jgi:hypothetical protein